MIHGWSACITMPTDSRLGSLRHALIEAEFHDPLAKRNLFRFASQTYFTHLLEQVKEVLLLAGSG